MEERRGERREERGGEEIGGEEEGKDGEEEQEEQEERGRRGKQRKLTRTEQENERILSWQHHLLPSFPQSLPLSVQQWLLQTESMSDLLQITRSCTCVFSFTFAASADSLSRTDITLIVRDQVERSCRRGRESNDCHEEEQEEEEEERKMAEREREGGRRGLEIETRN